MVDGKGRIIKANPTSETIFGYNPGELCEINAEVLLPKQLRETCRDHREQLSKGPNVKKSWQGLDLWGLRKDGSRFPLEVSISPIIDKKLTIAFVIDISDHSIPTEEQGNLFNRFFRTRNAANFQGTGLGLHIEKEYIELMGRTIRFTSTLLKALHFSVALPLKPEKYEKNIP